MIENQEFMIKDLKLIVKTMLLINNLIGFEVKLMFITKNWKYLRICFPQFLPFLSDTKIWYF